MQDVIIDNPGNGRETTGDVEITLHEALFIRSGDNCNHGIIVMKKKHQKSSDGKNMDSSVKNASSQTNAKEKPEKQKNPWRDEYGRFLPGNQQTRGRMKVSREKFIECAKRSGGIMVALAQLAGIDRMTAAKYLKLVPEANDYFQSQKETVIDIAENQLVKLVNQGDKDAIFFLLKTIGKKRGYSERTETELSGTVHTNDRFTLTIENN